MAAGLRRLLPETRELHKALWLGAVLSAITCSYTLVKVARDAFFLSRLSASALPVVYMVVGVLALAVTWVFGRFTHRQSPLRTLISTSLVSAVGLAAFAFAFQSHLAWLPMAFYAWVNVYGLILVSQFWNFTSSRSDPSEAKRIMGIIGGGGILGGLAGGWFAALTAQRLPLELLVAGAAGLLVVMVVGLAIAVRQGQVTHPEEPVDETRVPATPLSISYVRWLALATLCSVIVTGMVDFQFKVVAQAIYPEAPGLAAFFGRFFVVLNLAALALQLLGTRWLLQRFGAGPASAMLPTGLAVGAIATLVSPGFWTVMATRLWDQLVRFTINKSTGELFYFPLEPGLRRRAKAFIEGGIERFGDAVAGALILGAALVLDTRPITLSAIMLALMAVWLFAWFRLSGGYVRELGRSLRRMNPEAREAALSLRERSVLKELVRALESPYELVVLQAVDLLIDNAPPLLTPRLPRLLEHRSPRVRARALELASQYPDEIGREAVARLVHDPDPMVRLQALRLHTALGGGKSLAAVEEFLDAEDPGVRATALACMVEFAAPDDVPRVRSAIEERLHAADPNERVIATEAVGARPVPNGLEDLLLPLLADPDLAVRRAALRSVGRAHWRDQVPALIRALAIRDTEPAAKDGLIAFGDAVVGTLGDWLGDPQVPTPIRRGIPHVLARIPTQDSVASLFRARDRDDVVLYYRVLKALHEIRVANSTLSFPPDRVNENLDYDVRAFLTAEIHAESQRDAGDEAGRFLLRVLHERRAQAFNRIFRSLALLYPARATNAAYRGLLSENARVRGSAEEYVESALSVEQRALVGPLLPQALPEDRLQLAATRYQLVPLDPHDSLAALLESNDPWLRTCALFVAGRRRERRFLSRVEANLDARDERVRETAGWARLALSGA